MIRCTHALYIGNTNVIELRGVINSANSEPDTGATVQATVVDANGAEVAGQSWPLTLDHMTGGNYEGITEPALAIAAGAYYVIQVTAVDSNGDTGYWELPVVGAVRK